jgi:hypothetical protein
METRTTLIRYFINDIDPSLPLAANFAVMHHAAFPTTMW